jgi:hypothetical protein
MELKPMAKLNESPCTIDEINRTLRDFGRNDCILVWRSIGSNIFFEFGIPTIRQIQKRTGMPLTVMRGSIAIGIHADDWFMQVNSVNVLSGEDVNSDNITKVGGEYFVGKPFPEFSFSREGILQLSFDDEVSIRIEKNERYDDMIDVEGELCIYLPRGDAFVFNYERGFYMERDSEGP